MDILNHGSKIFYISSILIILSSCKKDSIKLPIEYDSNVIISIRNTCYAKSIESIGEREYWKIYNQANDTLQCWIKNRLLGARPIWKSEWEIDSLICFNKDATKLRLFILDKCILDECCQDDIGYLYGVRIKGQWYFFNAPTMILPREYYQDSINTPLSFKKMKQIATDNIYRGYAIKDETGNYKINDYFFSDLTSVAWGPSTNTPAQWDSTYLEIVRKNWEQKEK